MTQLSFAQTLLHFSEKVLAEVEDPSFDSERCVDYLPKAINELKQINIKFMSINDLRQDGPSIITKTWAIRRALHQRLISFNQACAYQVQASFLQLRFVEDYLAEKMTSAPVLTPKDIKFQDQAIPFKNLQYPNYLSQFRPELSALDLRAGDMIIVRGISFLSSLIASLGYRQTQFSHIMFIAEDPSTGVLHSIESYVGQGVKFFELDFALKNENVRLLWLRPKNQALAALAAATIRQEVVTQEQNKTPIAYDYALDFSDHSTMSCAEVSQAALQKASHGQFNIPYYPNEIRGAKSLLNSLGVKEGPTFEPGDMEIDPRFELMGEFRDLRLTRDARQKDAIMTMMFRWMNEKNYQLVGSMNSKLAGGLIYDLRRTFLWPMVKKMLKLDEFSKDIPRKMLRTVTLVNQIGTVLLTQVQKADFEHQQAYGWPMTTIELYQTLEQLRQQDEQLYAKRKTRKKSQFHAWFRAKK